MKVTNFYKNAMDKLRKRALTPPEHTDEELGAGDYAGEGNHEDDMSTGYTTKITEIPDPEGMYDSTYVFEITLTGLNDITLYFKFGTYEEASELGKAISNHIGFKVG